MELAIKRDTVKKIFKFATLIGCLFLVLGGATIADARNWSRAKGTLYIVSYLDSTGVTLSDLPVRARRISIDVNLRRRTNSRNVQTTCKDIKRIRQRACTSRYRFRADGQGICVSKTRFTLNNYTSTSRNIFTQLKGLIECPTGFTAYLEAEGEIRRS